MYATKYIYKNIWVYYKYLNPPPNAQLEACQSYELGIWAPLDVAIS